MINVILFDHGNVLETSQDGFDQHLNQMAARYGFETGTELWHHIYISDAWEQAKRGIIGRDAFWAKRLSELGIEGQAAVDDFRTELFRYHGVDPAMRQLVEQLGDSYRLAVLSNTDRQDIGVYIEQENGFAGLFEAFVSSAAVGYAKPEPEVYQIALERINAVPEETLFIDDQARNTTAAEALGIPSIVFASLEQLRHDLQAHGVWQK